MDLPTTRQSSGDAPRKAKEAASAPDRVLVVDDEEVTRETLTDLLQAKGFEVIAVESGEESFDWIDDVDLVLLDAMLPGRDGWSICREIKVEHNALLPVIMVTARSTPEDVERTFDAGADDYIAKPFNVVELTARIGGRLRAHRAELELKRASEQLADLAEQNYRLYERARRDAEERAALLRELDHRVRNNLSVIMGLVAMERNREPPRATTAALESLEGRLRSFLLVHEALRRENYGTVPVKEIVERLAQRLRNGYGLEDRIDLDVSIEPFMLGETQGFALALVLNELLTNAFRHAFPNERPGTVSVRMRQRDGRVVLDLADDGVGIDSGDATAGQGSGRPIIRALVRSELGGQQHELPADQGTHVRVTFPLESAELAEAEPDAQDRGQYAAR